MIPVCRTAGMFESLQGIFKTENDCMVLDCKGANDEN